MSNSPWPGPPVPPSSEPVFDVAAGTRPITLPDGTRVDMPAAMVAPSPPMYNPAVSYNIDQDSLLALNDPAVRCNTCRHGLVVCSAAAVHNRHEDGTPFVDWVGWCLVQPGTKISLRNLCPLQCSRYEALSTTTPEEST